jgi:hypothetical protein
MTRINDRLAHAFRKQRAHQMKVAANGGGVLTTFPSGRTERTFASAEFGFHAVAAFNAARFLLAREAERNPEALANG